MDIPSTAVAVTFKPVASPTVFSCAAVADVEATVIVNWSALLVLRSSRSAIAVLEIVAVIAPEVANAAIVFASDTVAFPELTVIVKLPSRPTVLPVVPSLPSKVVISAAVPLIVATAVASVNPVDMPLIVSRFPESTVPVSVTVIAASPFKVY